MDQNIGTIGESVVIKGELRAEEDLTIEGQVNGQIDLNQSVLTIGSAGRLTADINARVVIVQGKVNGTITATDTIEVKESASVDGELIAPRVGIADGAYFKGQIDMRRSDSQPQQKSGGKGSGQGTSTAKSPTAPRAAASTPLAASPA